MSTRNLRRLSWVFGSVILMIAMAETAPAADTGIEGVIYVSPSRPGPERADAPGRTPVANTGFIVQRGEEKLASFKTDSEGHFQVTVPPGHYIVSRENAGAIGRWRFEVDVVAGKMARVDWTADSGMR